MTNHTHKPHHAKPHHVKDHHEPEQEAHSFTDQVSEKFHDACEKYQEIHDQVEDFSNDLRKKVKNQPLVALGFALAFGVMLGKLLK